MERILLLGSGDLAEEVAAALEPLEVELTALDEPAMEEVESALEEAGPSRVLVVSRDDTFALRWALFVRHRDPAAPLLVTIFDPTTAQQVDRLVENCRVTSMADIVAPSLAGPCLGRCCGLTTRAPPCCWSGRSASPSSCCSRRSAA